VDSELRRTWFAAGSIEQRAGGRVHLVFRQSEFAAPGEQTPEKYAKEEGYELHGRVTRCDPPGLLAFIWDESEVTFELLARGDGVLLTLTHRKLANRKETVDVSGGWHVFLDLLRDRLQGVMPRSFWAAVEALEREYDARIPRH
jgi:uncharacterized protein YndB with AHSA1/START domain